MPVSQVQMNIAAQHQMSINVFRQQFLHSFRLAIADIQTTEPFATYCENSGSTMICAMAYKNEQTKTFDIELANLGNAQAILTVINYEHKTLEVQALNKPHNTANDGIDMLYKYPESKGKFKNLEITRSIGDLNAGTIKEPWYAERSFLDQGIQYFIILKQPGSDQLRDTLNYKAIQQKINQGQRITAADFNMTQVIDIDNIPKGQIALSMVCEGHGDNGYAISQRAITLLPALMQNLITPETPAAIAAQKSRAKQAQRSMVFEELTKLQSRLVVLPAISFADIKNDRLDSSKMIGNFKIIKNHIHQIDKKHAEKGYIFYKFYQSSYHQLEQYLNAAIKDINNKDNLILLMSAMKSFSRRALIWGVWGDMKYGGDATWKHDAVYEKLRNARGADDVNRLLPGSKKLSMDHRLNDDQINQYINSLIKKSSLPTKFALLNSLYLIENKTFHVKDMRNNIKNLLEAKVILWPFCINHHYGLLIIEKAGDTTVVTLINGLNNDGFADHEELIQNRVNTLIKELNEYPNNTHRIWNVNTSFIRLNIPPQADSHNCGVAICYVAKILLNNIQISFEDTTTPYDYTPFRIEMAKEIATTIDIYASKKRSHGQDDDDDVLPVETSKNNHSKKLKHDNLDPMFNIPLPKGMILGKAITNGNCLFDSIAQLINDGRTATDLRQLAVSYMKNPDNEDKLTPFIGGKEALDARIALMDNTLEYADQFEVMALAFALNKQIIIISNHIPLPPIGNPSDPILYLNHYHDTDSKTGLQGGHYEPISLAPNTDIDKIAIELVHRSDIARTVGATNVTTGQAPQFNNTLTAYKKLTSPLPLIPIKINILAASSSL